VLEPFLGKSRIRNHGRRIVEGQRLMQAASDPLLGWIRVNDRYGVKRDFYVRQLWDAKGSAHRFGEADDDEDLRDTLRTDPGPCSCSLGRRGRDFRLPRWAPQFRPRIGHLRRALRRPERA
jgi:hypothetical protein